MNRDDKYFTWSVSQLKEELKNRGASLKGKKKDLRDRLRFYDENNNFQTSTVPSTSSGPDPSFWSPNDCDYRDVNANSVIPMVTEHHIRLFLDRFNVKKVDLGKEMYQNAYLLCVKIAKCNYLTFLRAHCLAEMKKDVQYMVDIRFSPNGFIEATHCECAVGSGITAHCKHVAVLLWAIEQMGREKKMVVKAVCTQRLQSFHRPSKIYFGSPIKAERLPTRKSIHQSDSDTEPMVLAPEDYDAEYLNYKVRNDCINFAATQQITMPMLRVYKPADLYAAIWDRCYSKNNPEDQLLHEFQLVTITDEEIDKIEKETRSQADNKSWHEHRRHRITADYI